MFLGSYGDYEVKKEIGYPYVDDLLEREGLLLSKATSLWLFGEVPSLQKKVVTQIVSKGLL